MNRKPMIVSCCIVACALMGASDAFAQSRFLVNDRTNDRIVLIADEDGDGVIDEKTELWTYFDGTNAAGTLPPSNPTALGTSRLGWVLMGDQGNGVVYLLRDLNGDGTAQGAGESVVFADMDNLSGHSLAFPTGAAFDSQGRMYVSNAGNNFGPDAIYRLQDLNGDGTAMGEGEITIYVGEGAFGPGNGPFVPYQLVFDENDVLYMRNTGAESLGIRGIWRFEDKNGNGRADDEGEWWNFFGQDNESGLEVGTGFDIDLDRVRDDCLYMINTLSGPLRRQVIRACDLNGDGTANGKGEAEIVWETEVSGFTPIDLVSLSNGDVLITDNSASGDANREIIRLRDTTGDGLFDEQTVFVANKDETIGNVREAKAIVRFGDLNGDELVNVSDLLALFENWGTCENLYNCPGDLNGDGEVNVTDLLLMFNNWG
jgi:hypothetical protein